MPLTDFPFGLSSFGIPLVGSGPVLTTGKVWFVNSATGINAPGRGQGPDTPAASLAWTMANLVRSGFGDTVMVMPGHAEAISAAASIACNKTNVTVIGLGIGSLRPTFTWGTLTTATITVSAAGVRFVNCIFSLTGVDAVAVGFEVTGAHFQCLNCHFQLGDATNQSVIGVSLGAGSDWARFEACTFINVTAGATSAIQGVVAIDRLVVKDCWFDLDCTAAINNTTIAWTNALVDRNSFYLRGSGKSLVLVATTTGIIRDNVSFITANIAAGGSMTAAGAFKANNLAQENAGVASSAVLDPTSAAIT